MPVSERRWRFVTMFDALFEDALSLRRDVDIAWGCYFETEECALMAQLLFAADLRLNFDQKKTEREGFEPSLGYKPKHAFQACAINHSATSPDGVGRKVIADMRLSGQGI
jgi:hypothetical protein